MSNLSRLTLAATIASLFMAGCANHPETRSTTPSSTTTTTTRTTSSPTTSNTRPVHRADTAVTREPTSDTTTVDETDATGIPACDDYLSSYLACHRAAKIFAPDQLDARYQAMRTSLLRDSKNPDIRPQLGARCNSLATQLRQALHGKSCASTPASGSSTQ